MKHTSNAKDRMKAAGAAPASTPTGKANVMGIWTATIRDPQGNVIDEIEWQNLIVNAGLDHLLNSTLAGGTQITSWYLGLIDGTPTVAAGDTMASHAGWVEVTGYDEAARQAWTAGTVSGQSVDNTASAAVFTITSNGTTVGGALLTSVSTKGGTTDTLFAAGAFTQGDVTLSAGSTITVTATFTQSAA